MSLTQLASSPPPFEPQLAPEVAAFMWTVAHLPHLYLVGAGLAGAGAWCLGIRRGTLPSQRRRTALRVAVRWPFLLAGLAAVTGWWCIGRYLEPRLRSR